MRTPNLGTVQFDVGDPGEFSTVQDLARYVRDLELRTARAVTALAAGHLDPTYVEPLKPRPGDIRRAVGGAYWDPGGGEGVYFMNEAGVWIQLG